MDMVQIFFPFWLMCCIFTIEKYKLLSSLVQSLPFIVFLPFIVSEFPVLSPKIPKTNTVLLTPDILLAIEIPWQNTGRHWVVGFWPRRHLSTFITAIVKIRVEIHWHSPLIQLTFHWTLCIMSVHSICFSSVISMDVG